MPTYKFLSIQLIPTLHYLLQYFFIWAKEVALHDLDTFVVSSFRPLHLIVFMAGASSVGGMRIIGGRWNRVW